MRSIIYCVINEPSENDSIVKLTRDDILNIICELKKLNRDTYEDRGSCIWDWSDFKRINRRNVRNLKRLARIMKKYPNIVPVFYDSY